MRKCQPSRLDHGYEGNGTDNPFICSRGSTRTKSPRGRSQYQPLDDGHSKRRGAGVPRVR